MADKSTIEWTNSTWNPTVGCSIVSPGCTNCYAMKVANGLERRFDSAKYRGLTKVVNHNAVWTGEVRLDEAALLQPLKWKRGRRVFVNSMSDLFHESLSDADIDRVFAVMALCPQHMFQVLTKRAERMREYVGTASERVGDATFDLKKVRSCEAAAQAWNNVHGERWPLPNVWLGVSAERQEEADERIPFLLKTPAAIRFVSLEPLLGPIDLYNGDPDPRLGGHQATQTFIGDWWPAGAPKGVPSTHGLDWVIVGGESGSNARPVHPDWIRSLRDQCDAAEVEFFFKQWGEFHPSNSHDHEVTRCTRTPETIHVSGKREYMPSEQFRLIGGRVEGWAGMCRLGKKAAGRLLDGREHSAFPVIDRSVTQSGAAVVEAKTTAAAIS